jgi:hypothetical protein
MRPRRVLLISVLLLGLLSCGLLWRALRGAALEPLILPGALGVAAEWRGQTTLVLRYHLPGEPFSWRGLLAEKLEAEGWRGRSFTNMGARRPPFVTIFYTRERRFGPLLVIERAVFGGNADTPNTAIVELTREVYVGERAVAGKRRGCLFCLE